MDQPKIERLLRLMMLLTVNNRYTVNDIASRLDLSVRSVYRYIDTLREAGFVIKKSDDHIRIDKSSPHLKEISELVHFTEEEAYILKSAIESIDENNLLKQNLKKKLYTVYDYKILAETTVHKKDARNVNILIDAIMEKKQVVLIDYHSAHSKEIRNRIIEPFLFTTNYIQIWGYDTEKQENRLFKVSRIEKAEQTSSSWQYEAKHTAGKIDIFRISSLESRPVKLRMGLLSASLLTEEYPLSEKFLTKISDNEYILETEVCSYDGVGRFVMGLLHDIEILGNDDFVDYIRKRIRSLKK
ncbi:MAG: WYL domain-containing protein [Prevotellaceae bacterium]|jgi:predicted DNA-binding transcriptional regulator YafY|nr:WYL domain-containing protein [Prevotellaceae bacterium]